MQNTTALLKIRLATTILTQKARLQGVAYNVNNHVAYLAQNNGLPCQQAITQAITLNVLHNLNLNFKNLSLNFAKLYNAFTSINLHPAYMVRLTATPNLNYMFE
jgi:hypothetical protein